jgi:hypothetical protein
MHIFTHVDIASIVDPYVQEAHQKGQAEGKREGAGENEAYIARQLDDHTEEEGPFATVDVGDPGDRETAQDLTNVERVGKEFDM